MRALRATGPAGQTALEMAAIWLVLAAVYFLFAGSISVDEGLACAVCAGLTGLWCARATRRGSMSFAGAGRSVRLVAAACAGLPRATLTVGADLAQIVLGTRAGGRARSLPTSDAPWAAGAPVDRGFGLLAASLAPDSYVLRLDTERGERVEHALDGGGR